MKILSNDIKHYVAAKQKNIYVELAKTKKTFLTIILCVSITYSIFNKNQRNFRTHTEGLNAGKRVSDFVFLTWLKFYQMQKIFYEKNR